MCPILPARREPDRRPFSTEFAMRHISGLALLLMSLFLFTGCAGRRPDDRGYIRQWLVLAPINFGEYYNAEDIDKDTIPHEAQMTPKPGDTITVASEEDVNGTIKTVQKQLTWKPVVTDDFFLDFNALLGLESSEKCGGYAVAYIETAREMKDITFSFSTNDNGALFLNGQKIWSLVIPRALEEDSDSVPNLTLRKGINVIVFKIWNDSNNWQCCLRILTKDGTPVQNVKVYLSN
jgi:hypothetical protein